MTIAIKPHAPATTRFSARPARSHLVSTRLDTPIGELFLEGDGHLLTRLELPGRDRVNVPSEPNPASGLVAVAQLQEYFAGERRTFDLDLAPEGTEFQLRVWAALLEIEYGSTASYGDIANRIGNPRAPRAVGMANNRNPIAVIVPCHRVIGANGDLVGYGGGLDTKRHLLALEGSLAV